MFNPEIHAHLLALGFAYTHHEEDFEDRGGPESGPMISHYPAWDEYETDDWRVIVDHHGRAGLSEARDLAFEAYCDEMEAQAESHEDVVALGYHQY